MTPLNYSVGAIDSIVLIDGFSYQESAFGQTIKYEKIHDLSACILLAILNKPSRLVNAEFAYLRIKLELTQGGLADLFGVKEQTISLWERRVIQIPQINDASLRQLFKENGRTHFGRRKLKRLFDDFLGYAKNESKCTYQLSFKDDSWQFCHVVDNENSVFSKSFKLDQHIKLELLNPDLYEELHYEVKA